MPRKEDYYAPDQIDAYNQVRAIGDDFGCISEVSIRFDNGNITVLCTCREVAKSPDGPVVVQALVRRPEKNAREVWVMVFSALQDCWHQLDRGVLAAAPPKTAYGWGGRPVVRRR